MKMEADTFLFTTEERFVASTCANKRRNMLKTFSRFKGVLNYVFVRKHQERRVLECLECEHFRQVHCWIRDEVV